MPKICIIIRAFLQPFLVIKIYHKTEVLPIILRCITYLNLDWIKIYDVKIFFSVFGFFTSYMNLTILTKMMNLWKVVFQQFLLIGLLFRHLVYLMLKIFAWEIWNITVANKSYHFWAFLRFWRNHPKYRKKWYLIWTPLVFLIRWSFKKNFEKKKKFKLFWKKNSKPKPKKIIIFHC